MKKTWHLKSMPIIVLVHALGITWYRLLERGDMHIGPEIGAYILFIVLYAISLNEK